MATVRVSIDRGRIARLIRLPGGIVDRDLRRRANRVADRARRSAPGSMKEAISVDLVGSGRQRHAQVVLDHPAAVFVTKGTGLYGPRGEWIRPQTAQALRFTGSGGQVVFAARVRGIRPNNFMRRALDAAR